MAIRAPPRAGWVPDLQSYPMSKCRKLGNRFKPCKNAAAVLDSWQQSIATGRTRAACVLSETGHDVGALPYSAGIAGRRSLRLSNTTEGSAV